MSDPRWTTVDGLLEAALERDPQERAAFLREACAGNDTLRREVESLLAHAIAKDFLDRPAHNLRETPPTQDKQWSVGRSLGPYRIVGLLGRGGMGEVYRAHDTTLGRDVAIKMLPSVFTTDADRRARFDREARVLAALNHPHIGAIYGVQETDGTRALVLELVEGDTLADRIATGALPVQEALSIARQIAEGLEAAHEKGVVHRDLKPANVKITPQGVVKVLDFGLAKATGDGSGPDLTQSPTAMMHDTREGVILGTAPYMSPEQARGQVADRRTDVWAFGCVLYEMLTGRPAFHGASGADTLAGVIEREPDWSRMSSTPARVNEIVRRCLEKDVRKRRRDLGDIRVELEHILSKPASEPSLDYSGANRRRVAWTGIGLLLVLVPLGVAMVRRLAPPPAPEMRVDISTADTANGTSFAISPDGRHLVFAALSGGRSLLRLRALDRDRDVPLEGTDGAILPFWSPDSRSIGFFDSGHLKRLDLDGEAVQTLARAEPGQGGTWQSDGIIVFAPSQTSSLFRVPASGGEPAPVTRLAPGHLSHRFPTFLPGGREFLFYAIGTDDARGIYLGSLDTGEATRLTDADTAGDYLAPGWLLFARQGALVARRFDVARRTLTGDPIRVTESVATGPVVPRAALSVSASGAIAYRTGGTTPRQLTLFDRAGKALGTMGEPDRDGLMNVELSSDGTRAAVERSVQNNVDVWLVDPTRTARFTNDNAIERFPLWSADGTRIAYNSNSGLHVRASSGDGPAEVLYESPTVKPLCDWSPDGQHLLYVEIDPQTGSPNLMTLPVSGNRTPEPFLATAAIELWGQFSPDGKWVAYQSNQSGRMEVYVRSFHGAGGQWLVSAGGGIHPRWSSNTELLYLAPDGRLQSAAINARGGAIEVGRPVSLFPTMIVGGGTGSPGFRQQYDVTADGRLVINVALESSPTPITLLLNWRPHP